MQLPFLSRTMILSVVCALTLCGGAWTARAEDKPAAKPAPAPAAPAPAPAAVKPAAPATAPAATTTAKPGASKPEAGKTDEPIVARINDTEVITKSDFDKIVGYALQAQMVQARAHGVQMDGPPQLTHEQKLKILDDFVTTRIIALLATQAGVKVTDEEVNQKIDAGKARLPQNTTFEQYLSKQNLTEAKFRENVKTRLLIDHFRDEKTKDVTATDEEVQKEYDKGKANGFFDLADFQHIFIRVDGADQAAWDTGKKAADAAFARLKKREDFGAVAKEVSQDPESKDKGGQYTSISRHRMLPDVDKLLFTAPIGTVNEPIKGQFGWHIIKVTKREPMPEDKAKAGLKDALSQSKKNLALKKVVDDARAKMNVQLMLPPETDASPTPPPAATPTAPAAPGATPAPAPSAPLDKAI